MTIFEQAIPLSERIQWVMLKSALEYDVTAETLSKRLGWSIGKVRQCVCGNPRSLRIDTISEFVFACSGQMLRFRLDMEKAE